MPIEPDPAESAEPAGPADPDARLPADAACGGRPH